ncbi:MAG: RNA polymerase sigma factor, partial [Clostridia bacterium]|nr:RNA polymerase sigma factor [Clostridia bacterium]
MSTDKLIKRIINGDVSAFDLLYEQTRKSVYYVALSVLRDKRLAEDVMQSTYIKVLQNVSRYRLGTNASAWIVKIARNEALNMRKSLSREITVVAEQNSFLFDTECTDDYGLLIDLARRILPDDEFAALMLAATCGYKRREIASA